MAILWLLVVFCMLCEVGERNEWFHSDNTFWTLPLCSPMLNYFLVWRCQKCCTKMSLSTKFWSLHIKHASSALYGCNYLWQGCFRCQTFEHWLGTGLLRGRWVTTCVRQIFQCNGVDNANPFSGLCFCIVANLAFDFLSARVSLRYFSTKLAFVRIMSTNEIAKFMLIFLRKQWWNIKIGYKMVKEREKNRRT